MAKDPGSRTIQVVRVPKVDRLSPTPTFGGYASPLVPYNSGLPYNADGQDVPTHLVEGCAILPRTSFEREKGWVIVAGRTVIAPYGSDVLSDDQVRIDSLLWDVDGEPGDYEDRKGRGKAMIFYLKRLGT